MSLSTEDRRFLDLAIEQARLGWKEGGIPIGAVLVHQGEVLAAGRNRRVQMGSAIRHGETDAIERYVDEALPGVPDPLLHRDEFGVERFEELPIFRIVIGENESFSASEDWLASRGVELVVADDPACKDLMATMMQDKPELWAEDIGEEA